MKAFVSVFSMELRKLFSYRVDFWLNFLGTVFFQFIVSYSLWSSVYTDPIHHQINGLNFQQMIYYYVLSPLIFKMVMGQQMGYYSTEIYSGELTRYLLYPVSCFQFKLATHLANCFFSLSQFILGLLLFAWIFRIPEATPLTLPHLAMGLFSVFLASILYFSLCSSLEIVAFWAEHVWTLLVMLRFITGILGGALLPLTLFPQWAQEFFRYLPFQYLVSFPISVFQGKVDFNTYWQQNGLLIMWIFVFLFCFQLIWNKGLREYSGVGI